MTAFGLRRDTRPERYTLRFDLDLDRWRFSGHERCEMVLDAPRSEIVLHAVGLDLGAPLIRAGCTRASTSRPSKRASRSART